jgi:glycosyltransferase involved in cell wall biosynthesis
MNEVDTLSLDGALDVGSRKAMLIGGCAKAMLRFRAALIRELSRQGQEVVAVAPQTDAETEHALRAQGLTRFIAAPLDRAGMNPMHDLVALWSLHRAIARERPDTVLTYNIKPMVYGTLAAWLAGTKRRIAMVEGLGYAYTPGRELKRRVARALSNVLYRIPCTLAHGLVVLNEDDRAFFADRFLRANTDRIHLLPGIGVDLDEYRREPLPEGPLTFVLIGRLLRDKGVIDFVNAARQVKVSDPTIRFVLVGGTDDNPASVARREVDAWVAEGLVTYAGEVSDVRPWLRQSHVFVLPSYREGFPRTIMEAMAMGRPCLTTDVPGCRGAVVHGQTGLIVQPANSGQLAAAMLWLAENRAALTTMASNADAYAYLNFDAKTAAVWLAQLMVAGVPPTRLGAAAHAHAA